MTKLSNLNSAAVLNASDLVYVVQNGVSLKATVAQISVGAILTAGRVPFMGGLGVLTDSANLTFAGGTLTVATAVATPLVGSSSAANVGIMTNSVERWRVNNTGFHLVPSGDNDRNIGDPSLRIATGYFGTAVVTPAVTSAGALLISSSVGALQFSSATGVVSTNSDFTHTFGDSTHRWISVFAGSVDTGSTASLLLRTNNTLTQAKIVNAGDGTNFANIQGGASPFSPVIFSNGGDTNIGLIFSSKGTGSVDITTGGTFSGDINSGRQLQARFAHTANTVNYLNHTGGISGQSPFIQALGSDTNIGIRIIASGTGAIVFEAPGGTTQFSVLGTASSTRNITVTGSNGGNPTLGVTAGSLAITPAVVIAGANLQIGTTPASVATAGIGLPFASALTARKSDNSGDIEVIATSTLNSVVNIVTVGTAQTSGASAGVLLRGRSGAGVPVAADIPSGTWALWRDTSGATTKIYYNNAGTIQATAAFT